MSPFVCLLAGGRVFALLFGPVYGGLGLHWELSEELCKLHPGFRWKNHSSRDPVLCPSASRPCQPLDAASRCDLPLHCVICHDGFSHNAFFSQCQGKRTNNVLLRQPNMLPARLGSWTHFLPLEWIPSAEAVFSFPLFSLSPSPFLPRLLLLRKVLSAGWNIHPAGKFGIANNCWEFIDQSVCAKCIYTGNNGIRCFTLSVQSLVMKPCENMQRAEDSIGTNHWEIISKHVNMSIFICRFIITLPFKKWLWRPVPLLFKITKWHFVALNLPF